MTQPVPGGRGGWPGGPPAQYAQPYPVQGFPQQGWAPQPYGPALGRPGLGSNFGAPAGLPQYGPGPSMPAPPRPKSPLRAILIGLIAVTVVAIVGLVVASNVQSTTTTTQYQNDDYKVPPPDTNPPPLPQPASVEDARDRVSKNIFYGQTVPSPVRCGTGPINAGTASDETLRTHFEGMMECLVRVWEPPIAGASYTVVRPTVTVYGQKITTKCGESGVNAFYCSIDQQVYYSSRLAKEVPIVGSDKWAADIVIAHEFAHAIQARTGILTAVYLLRQSAATEPENLNVARRKELQADCFAGMFIRSVSSSLKLVQSDVTGIMQTFDALADDTLTGDPNIVGDHGRSASRQFWAAAGIGNASVGACNTFVAPDEQVR